MQFPGCSYLQLLSRFWDKAKRRKSYHSNFKGVGGQGSFYTKLFISLGLCLGAGFPAAAETAQLICPAELAPSIEAITGGSAFRRAHWGILVQTVDVEPQTLYAHNADKFFIPASNAKLLTTAAALVQLGPEFQIQTKVYQLQTNSQNVSLRVVGRGDPSLSNAQLKELAQQLRNQGIEQIQTLIADDQYFQGEQVHPTWEWEDLQAGYGAPVNSLILNQNALGLTLIPQTLDQPLAIEWDDPIYARNWQIVNQSTTVAQTAPEFVQVGRDLAEPILYVQGQLRVGSAAEPVAVSIPQPTEHFLARFKQILAEQLIQVNQTTIASNLLPSSARPIAVVTSPNLAELLVETNQQSNNLYAEALLRILGTEQLSNQTTSSLERGINTLRSLLAELGVEPTGYKLVDGSGLSRQNLVSPKALVETLQLMARSPYTSSYRASLATAGVNGTLRSRFQNTSAQGKFYGKTGALSGVSALSGYLEPTHAPQLAISVLVNHTELLSEVQPAIDAIVELLARLKQC